MKVFFLKQHTKNSRFSLIKKAFLIFSFQLSVFSFSQTAQRTCDLTIEEPSWQAVIGGVAVSTCVETSYGVALLSDGRLLSACTGSGTVIWQRSIRGRPSPYLASFGDFLYVVTDGSRLNLVNPSGMTLWTEKCPFEVADFPCVGRDGRAFVRGKKGLACYGLDGTRRWKCDTEELAPLPISTLDDGSILVFLKNLRNNLSVAVRFSPFGERLEDITFTGIISSVANCSLGVLVSLKNGSIGLVSAGEQKTVSAKWVNGSGNTSGAFKICYSKSSGNSSFFFQNGARTEAVIVKIDDGEILNRFQVGSISDFKIACDTASGYFISGSMGACEFCEDGTILFAAKLPEQSKWNSIFYTNKNFLLLTMKDWTIKGFLMNQSVQTAGTMQNKKLPISYITAAPTDSSLTALGIRPLNDDKMAEISSALKQGDYGKKESDYLSLVKAEAQNYLASRTTKPVFNSDNSDFFAENAVYTQNLLYIMSKTGTREFSVYFSQLLSSEIDKSQLLSLIAFAGNMGYDEDGLTLLALENLLVTKIQPTDQLTLKSICDATYEICRFMGRPALNKRGKNILSRMLFTQYDKSIQDYARKTLEKMISFEKK